MFRDIEDYEGLYKVSNDGRVYSLLTGKFLKPTVKKDGYEVVTLVKDHKNKYFRVHRLVATAFLENTNNYPVINHKDENKLNNNVDNLEWCSISYNTKYSYERNEKIRDHLQNISKKGVERKKKKMLIDGIFFNGKKEAAIYFGVNEKTIYNWLKGGKNVHHQCQCA